MAAATYFDAVQKIYVAFYGRPAEPSGLLYWANRLDSNGGNISAIINAFGESTESSNLYSGSTNAAVVSAIYQQILGRAPDADGSAFYVSKLQSNEYKASEVAYRIIDGVKGADVATVANKLSVAKAFTDAVTLDSAATLAYSGTAAETVGRDLLFGVTTSTTTANVADAIADLKDGGSVVDDVIVLTSADDEQDFSDSSSGVTVRINGDDDAVDGDDFEITGSSFNDTFILESFKDLVINAADGVDTLDLSEMEPGADNGDVSLTSGLADAALSPGGGAISLLGFENVIASNDGGRIVGTSGANTITLGEGTDDIVAGAGADTIVGDEDTFTTGTDTISGGLGQDTFELSGGDTQTFEQGDFTGIEVIIYTADGDDVTITAGDLFDDDAAPTTGITGGVTNIVVENGGDNTLNLTLAGDEINLLGVTFTGVQTLGADAGGGGNINIDADSLAGIETLNGGAADVLVMVEAGEYDLSSLTINDATNIESGAGDLDQTLVISRLGDIVN